MTFPGQSLPPAVPARVMDALLAHPHDDTPPAIAVVLDDPELTVGAIRAALDELQAAGRAHTADGHWQLTPPTARCDARAQRPRCRKSQSPRLKGSGTLSRTH
jgi:hypothetical protein